jgi:bacillithiol biosynthesis cysteine-adding enzyme BshC
MALCFQTLLYKLFGEQGLLVLDGDDAELKKIFVPVMKEELIRQPSAGVLNVSNEKFRLDYPLQVSHREINLFYLTGESRSRLVKTDAGFATADGKLNFTGAECLYELENSPERFSPNVILRPLYQNMVLPDVAFTGGPAEVVYFFQIKKVFEEFRIDFPVVFLRSCALLISEKQSDRIRKLQWSDSMIFQKTETLLNTYLQSVNGNVAALSTEFELLGELFNGILKKAAEVDGTLHAAVEAEKTRALKGLQMIDEKIKRALKRKHDEQLQRVRKLKEDLFPGEGLQERKESFLSYYATYGPNLLQELLQHLNPLDQQFTILRLE